jgi:hypothetical protein
MSWIESDQGLCQKTIRSRKSQLTLSRFNLNAGLITYIVIAFLIITYCFKRFFGKTENNSKLTDSERQIVITRRLVVFCFSCFRFLEKPASYLKFF